MSSNQWRVKLDVPAATRFLHVIRLAAAGAAAEAGLDAEEIEDVKIAIDELCSVAIAAASDEAVLSIELIAVEDGLLIEAAIPTTGPVEVDEMGHAIISATVDTFAVVDGDPGRFQLAKSHRGQ